MNSHSEKDSPAGEKWLAGRGRGCHAGTRDLDLGGGKGCRANALEGPRKGATAKAAQLPAADLICTKNSRQKAQKDDQPDIACCLWLLQDFFRADAGIQISPDFMLHT